MPRKPTSPTSPAQLKRRFAKAVFSPAGARAKVKPGDIGRLLKRGTEHWRCGEFRQAEFCFQSILRDHPHHGEALNLMGMLALEAQRYDVSVSLLEKAVKSAPSDPNYRNNLANSLIGDGAPDEALRHLRKALSISPGLNEALMNKIRAHRMLGEGQAALETCRKVLKTDDAFLPARVAEAEILLEMGRTDVATPLFREIIKIDPVNVAAIAGLASATKFKSGNTDITGIEATLERLSNQDKRQISIRYSAGKIREDMGDHEAAMTHFNAAKQLSTATFNLPAYRRHIDGQIRLFDRRFFQHRTGYGSASQRPVFVVGMPRSGTTLAERIIASHPRGAGAGELPHIELILNRIVQERQQPVQMDKAFRGLTRAQTKQFAERYLSVLKRHSHSAVRVVDKMPHNFQALGLIAILFPNARIIHCIRDPVDTCLSCYTHNLRDSHAYNNSLETLGGFYVQYRRLMDHWSDVLPLKMLHFPYEDVVNRQEEKSRELIAFLGLEWDDACLQFHEYAGSVRTYSAVQVRQPIYRSSLNRADTYGALLNPLRTALGKYAV